MEHKEYVYCIDSDPNRCVWVGLSMEYDGNNVSIEKIQIEGQAKEEIGFRGMITIEDEAGHTYFFKQYENNNQLVKERLENEHTNFILQQILKIKEESKPKFVP